jgi:membrane-associated phospholipid phosphatase
MCLQGVIAVLLLMSLRPVGLSIDWISAIPALGLDVVIAGLWLHLWRNPGRPDEWFVAEIVAAFLLMLVASHVLAPAQYVAAALKRPLVDAALARADAAIGIDVASLAWWTRVHPHADAGLTVAYYSFLPQLALLVPVTGFVARDREAMWEAVFHFQTCAILTVLGLALFPAAHAFQYLHFQPTLNEMRLIEQFNGIRDGTFTTIQFNNLEGLVSMPSFHLAGALIVVRALRRHALLFWPALVLNVLLAVSTVFTGAHYAVDLLGTGIMFSVSVWCWNVHGRTLLARSGPAAHTAQPALATSSGAVHG